MFPTLVKSNTQQGMTTQFTNLNLNKHTATNITVTAKPESKPESKLEYMVDYTF